MNPYAPPTSPYASAPAMAPAGAPGGIVSEQSVEMLRQTRPWVTLLGVLCFIGSALMLLGGLGMMAMGAMASATSAKTVAPMALGAVYIPFAGLYVYPGLKLTKYGSAIGRLLQTRAVADLDSALEQQKSFWKFAGITSIVMVVLYIVFIIGMVAVGVGSAMMLGK